MGAPVPTYSGMDALMFFQIVAAVFCGGVLLAFFLWAGWTANRLEAKGVSPSSLPFRIYIFLAAPPLFVAACLFSLS